MTRSHPISNAAAAVFALLALALAGPSIHAEEPLVTDRPDQTESSVTVPRGSLQLELGTTYTEESGDSRTLSYPELLLRWGVHERLELRFGIPGFTTEFEGPDSTRFEDTEVGLKVYMFAEDGWRPEMAFLGSLSLPTGADDVSADRVNPSFRFAFSHGLSDRVGLAYNLGMTWDTDIASTPTGLSRDTIAFFQYTVAVGVDLTDRWGAYGELFGDIPAESGAKAAHSLDGGVTYLIQDNLQWDAFVGVGLNDEADDWFIGTGLSFRVPK